MGEERLQKLLARAGLGSRRKVEELVRAGRVTVDGAVATVGDKADPLRSAVKVDGRRVQFPAGHRYVLLNKPKGFVTTKSDPEGRPTVMELLPPAWRKTLVPVGRLDFHSEGLLLLSDDGGFVQRVTHPRYGCTKTYEVKVKGVPAAEVLERLRGGVPLGGRRTAEARIEPLPRRRGERASKHAWLRVVLAEGRNRQIREMFFRAGHPVLKLRRVAIGAVSDPQLPVGAYRELTEPEVRRLSGERRRRTTR